MTSPITASAAPLSRRLVLKTMSLSLALPALPSLASPAGGPGLGTRCWRRSPRIDKLQSPSSSFSADEAQMLVRLAETILPSDATPGAQETGTGVFVVVSLQNEGVDTVGGIRQALAAVDQLALGQFGDNFNKLPQPAVDALAGVLSREPAFSLFWNGVRSLSVFHHFAMPAGYRTIGLPGPNIDRGGFPRPNRLPCLLNSDSPTLGTAL